MLSHWSPQKIEKAAQKHDKGRITSSLERHLVIESYQAIRSNPPRSLPLHRFVINTSCSLACTFPALLRASTPRAPKAAHCSWQRKMGEYGLNRVWIFPAASTPLQPVPAPHTGEILEQLVLYLLEQTALQGRKILRRDRHSLLGLQLCNALGEIQTWICLYQHQAKLLQSGNCKNTIS